MISVWALYHVCRSSCRFFAGVSVRIIRRRLDTRNLSTRSSFNLSVVPSTRIAIYTLSCCSLVTQRTSVASDGNCTVPWILSGTPHTLPSFTRLEKCGRSYRSSCLPGSVSLRSYLLVLGLPVHYLALLVLDAWC